MIKKLFRLACVAIMLACSASVSAKTSDSVELLTDFADYNHQFISSVQGEIPGPVKIAIGASLNQGLTQYVENIVTVEQATCMDESKIKDFIKKCNKVIKKSKVPEISSNESEDVIIKMYAETGRLIILTQIDNDLATIVVVTGMPAVQ
ncbi:MAG: hypothetical protein HDS96_00070 [Bacteroidales bacterium]|nr:hypothetical protein [Bacteroidales bacterium]